MQQNCISTFLLRTNLCIHVHFICSNLPLSVTLINTLTLLYFILIDVLFCLQLGRWQTTYQSQVTAVPKRTTAADSSHNPLPTEGSQSKQYHSGCPQ